MAKLKECEWCYTMGEMIEIALEHGVIVLEETELCETCESTARELMNYVK